MTQTCARCDWQPDDHTSHTDQRRQHADDWTHPLCACCSRSLPKGYTQVCEDCQQAAQGHLRAVLALYAELPQHIGHARAQTYDRGGRGGSDEHQLPGGALLALLGPGSDGGAPSRWGDRTHTADQYDTDTTSVTWTLDSWVQDWHAHRGWADPMPAANAPELGGYLERHGRWAANNHPAYAEYADDLRQLRTRLEHATGRVRTPVTAGAACFDCGGTLVRPVQDGLEVEDVVVCRACREVYSGARYLLALAARREEGLAGWVTYHAAAQAARRPLGTLWSWVQRLQVPAACRVHDRTVVVWYPAVDERAGAAARRRRTVDAAD